MIVTQGYGNSASDVILQGYRAAAANVPIIGGLFSPARTHIQYRPPAKSLRAKVYGVLPRLTLRNITAKVRFIPPDEPPVPIPEPLPLDFRHESRIAFTLPVVNLKASYKVSEADDDEIAEVLTLLSQCGAIDKADAKLIEMALANR